MAYPQRRAAPHRADVLRRWHDFCSMRVHTDTSRHPVREETKVKYLLIMLLSSPVLLAYRLRPTEMQSALLQALHYVLQHITR